MRRKVAVECHHTGEMSSVSKEVDSEKRQMRFPIEKRERANGEMEKP